MNWIDWLVLAGCLAMIVLYGVYKTRGAGNVKSYVKGDERMKWWTIGLSVMATQASAITFISTPGQAYAEGMGFAQFYFGLPIAMIIIAAVFIPIYHRLRVYTAYEYLENRFDLRTRQFTSLLFLISRGLAAGMTIYAPAIVLNTMVGWDLNLLCVLIGLLVITYTVSGGTRAVSATHKWQLAVMMGGMLMAMIFLMIEIGREVPLEGALSFAGMAGKLEMIDLKFDPGSKYNIWSGLIGGTFIALGYFGTDQSQVQRYLGGQSVNHIRTGLMFNATLKIPMQVMILFIGVLTFIFFQLKPDPLLFNPSLTEDMRQSEAGPQFLSLEEQYAANGERRREILIFMSREQASEGSTLEHVRPEVMAAMAERDSLRNETTALVGQTFSKRSTEDNDYVFLNYVMAYLPHGIVGLLLAVIFSAAMSSTAAELNSLGACAMMDFYKRSFAKGDDEKRDVRFGRLATLAFGLLAIVFALGAQLFDNLIEAVNQLGSLFYGTILGVFIVGFFFKQIGGRAVFVAAIIAEATVLGMYLATTSDVEVYGEPFKVGYLWYNLIGPAVVIAMVYPAQWIFGKKPRHEAG